MRSGHIVFTLVNLVLRERNLSRTVILPVVLYGYETWSLTFREKRRLRVSENMVLRRIFGTKGDEVTGEWRQLHNEKLNDPYCSPNNCSGDQIENNEMGGM